MLRRFFLTQHAVSLVVLLLLFVLMMQARLWAPYWDTRNVQAILTWDVMGYYFYLPARFIYHDLGHLTFATDIMREYGPSGSFYQAFQVPGAPAGQLVMKYTAGLAVLWTPFFWLGHWAAGSLGYPQDGFSAPYQVAIALGGLLFALLGLALVRRLLLRYFTDWTVALVLALLVLGTNYLQFAVFDAAMPHNYLFTAYALLLWLCAHYYARPGRGLAFAIGLTLGLMILIRPSEVVAVVIPLLWKVPNLAAARDRTAFLLRRWPDVLLLGAGGLLGVLPQSLYWHWATGHWLFYSYGDQHFSWLRPHVWPVLVSFRKGWLVYSPLFMLVLLGFVPLWRRHRGLAVPALAFFLLNLWVVSAWDIWWYGGSLGQRALVQSYAVLALPWAAAVAWVLAPGRAPLWRAVAAAAAVLLVDLNLFQHWQYMYGIIYPDEMSRPYYFAIFNKTKPSQDDYAKYNGALGLPRAARHYRTQPLGKLDFEQSPPDAATGVAAGLAYSGRQAFRGDTVLARSPTYRLKLDSAGLRPGDYLRASCRVYSEAGAWADKLVCTVERPGQVLTKYTVDLQNPLSTSRSWNLVYFYVRLPPDAQPTDEVKLYALTKGAQCLIDDLTLEKMVPQP